LKSGKKNPSSFAAASFDEEPCRALQVALTPYIARKLPCKQQSLYVAMQTTKLVCCRGTAKLVCCHANNKACVLSWEQQSSCYLTNRIRSRCITEV